MAESIKNTLHRRLARGVNLVKAQNLPLSAADVAEIEQDLRAYRSSGRHIAGHAGMVFLICAAFVAVITAFVMLGMAGYAVKVLYTRGTADGLVNLMLGSAGLGLYSALALRIASRKHTAYAHYCALSSALRPVSRARLKGCAHLCDLCPDARRILREADGGVLRQFHYDAMENAYFTDQNFTDVGTFGAVMGAAGPMVFAILFMCAGYYLASQAI